LILTPEDAWEQHLLGAIAKGGEALDGLVEYEPEWHYSYGKCKAVKILLGAANNAVRGAAEPRTLDGLVGSSEVPK